MQKFNSLIPISLYIHLPWCVRKCPYCDFNSHEARAGIPEDAYVNTLLNDLTAQLPLLAGRRFSSIFFGGGTPSLFSPQAIHKIISGIDALSPLAANIEITMEANPGTVDESRFKGFRAAGINRLSLGVQSFQAVKLKLLGRIHGRDEALRAIHAAYNAGFDNLNIDLMHGLPQQSLAEAIRDIRDALAFTPNHLSWYQLTIEPHTAFHRAPPKLPEEETLWDIQDQGKKIILDHGLAHYEVSAYALPDKQCLHNLNYWEFGDYLGIGAGAYSKITDFDQQKVVRQWQLKNPREYQDPKNNFLAQRKIVGENEIIFEFMLNALRLTEGVPSALFTDRTGLSEDVLLPTLTLARDKNLLIQDHSRLQPTNLGQQFLNDLIALFMTKN